MKQYKITTTKSQELFSLAIGFFIFLVGLWCLRYHGFFGLLILAGMALMGMAGANLQEINDQKNEEEDDGH